MPTYTCEKGFCGVTLTDEEKQAMIERDGTCSGNCASAACNKFIELTNKFGKYFDIAIMLYHRDTCSIIRLYDIEQIIDFMSKGRYLIHICVYNRKTKQYIDTSQNAIKIQSKEFIESEFNQEWNKLYKIYHFSWEYFIRYHSGACGMFCYNILKDNQMKGVSNTQEKKWKQRGVTIISQS